MRKFIMLMLASAGLTAFSQTVTPVFLPQFIQGVGSSNASDDRKVPFACRMTVSGLTPNATYRYYNRFVTDPASLTNNGQGNYTIVAQTGNWFRVTSASLATVGRYGEFTTDAAGSYTGWFVSEPSIATDFAPGTILYFRLMLNNGAGGGSVATRLTASEQVQVLGWGSASTQGTGLRTPANTDFSAKNFALFFDNNAGTGRPVAGTFVESDGVLNDANPSYYAPFYASSVDGQAGAWGTIIPNNLVNGIRKISHHALTDGAFLGAAVSSNGVFPSPVTGTANTVNTNTGLSELVIAPSFVVPVSLVSFTAEFLNKNTVTLQWISATENNLHRYVIERSYDGIYFSAIGEVAAAGSNRTYIYNDQLSSGTTFYRLRMIDVNGSERRSKVLTINNRNDALRVYPNPSKDRVTVMFEAVSKFAMLEVFNSAGMKVFEKALLSGSSTLNLDISRFPAGMYILILNDQGKEVKIKSTFHKQ